jgi:hypothetical protein
LCKPQTPDQKKIATQAGRRRRFAALAERCCAALFDVVRGRAERLSLDLLPGGSSPPTVALAGGSNPGLFVFVCLLYSSRVNLRSVLQVRKAALDRSLARVSDRVYCRFDCRIESAITDNASILRRAWRSDVTFFFFFFFFFCCFLVVVYPFFC